MASYVTIEKRYFETLLRRLECNSSSSDFDTPLNIPTVTIPKSDHDDLVRQSREYENLKQALYRGGVEPSSLETLIHTPSDLQQGGTTNGDRSKNGFTQAIRSGFPQSVNSTSTNGYYGEGSPGAWRNQKLLDGKTPKAAVDDSSRQGSFDNDNASFPSDDKADSPTTGDGRAISSRHHVDDIENRTISLKGIPERTTHRDIAAAIRGGALVDIFLRSRERLASVTFAKSKAAQEFFSHAKRQNFYILDRPVDVSWSERQFSLSAYLSTQLSNGASRNLIIRNVHPNLTEAMIREDMKHIHNLIVVNVTFEHGSVYISTNSVQKASFARNCMMSRMPYRLMRVEYYPDECAEPLPKLPDTSKKEIQRPVKTLNPMANRFQMLNLEDSDEDSDKESDEESGEEDGMTDSTLLGGGITWRNTAVAV